MVRAAHEHDLGTALQLRVGQRRGRRDEGIRGPGVPQDAVVLKVAVQLTDRRGGIGGGRVRSRCGRRQGRARHDEDRDASRGPASRHNLAAGRVRAIGRARPRTTPSHAIVTSPFAMVIHSLNARPDIWLRCQTGPPRLEPRSPPLSTGTARKGEHRHGLSGDRPIPLPYQPMRAISAAFRSMMPALQRRRQGRPRFVRSDELHRPKSRRSPVRRSRGSSHRQDTPLSSPVLAPSAPNKVRDGRHKPWCQNRLRLFLMVCPWCPSKSRIRRRKTKE